MNTKVLVISVVVVVFVLIVVVTFFAVRKANTNHDNNKQIGTAVITGKATNSSSVNVKFMVKVLDSGDDKSYNLKGVYNVKKTDGSIDTRYPHFEIGDEVYVQYSQKKVAGINVLDVRINREHYDYPN